MGMLAIMNKTGDNIAVGDKYYTPAQFWWMHYYYQGREMLIGNMLAAWFGFNDTNKNGKYDPNANESINPFFYMTMETPNVTATFAPLNIQPSVQVTPLQRVTGGSQINYTWAYNYTDVEFWLPCINHTNSAFKWGFNYSDPGTYMRGSFGFGVQAYIYYQYSLVLDSSTNQATLFSNYKSGDITQLWTRNDSKSSNNTITNPYIKVTTSQIPSSWIYCTGNWAFMMAGADKKVVLNETSGDSITANTTRNGLTDVHANVDGTNVFNYEFSKKTNYTQYMQGNPATHVNVPVLYASMPISNHTDFINLVSGMPQLMGSFAHLMLSYVINQTNHFTDGITFDKAWSILDPKSTAAFFVTGYPQFGPYHGGAIDHDPVFTAFFTPGSNWGSGTSVGSDSTVIIFIAIGAGVAGIVMIEGVRKKRTH